MPEIDSSGLVGLAVIGFEVPEIDSSGLVGLPVPGIRRSSSVPGAWSGIVLRVRVPSSRIVEDHTRWTGPSAGSGLQLTFLELEDFNKDLTGSVSLGCASVCGPVLK